MKLKYCVLVVAAAALWGCISVFFRMLTNAGYTSMQAVSMRVIVAASVFTVYLLLTDIKAFKIRLRDVPLFIGTGVISLVLFNFCYFSAIELSSAAVAAVLLYTSPIFVMLMSAVLFKERITAKKVIAIIVTFLGCALVTGAFGGGERATTAAVLFGVGSGLGYALYSIFGKVALRRYSPATVTEYTFLFAVIGTLPFGRPWEIAASPMTWEAAVGALCIGTFCCALPYVMYTEGLSGMEPGRAAILAAVEPVVAAAVGVIIFHESFTLTKSAGVALVVAAIIFLNIHEKKDLQTKTQ